MTTAVYEQYIKEMHHRFGYRATWLPNARIAVGDVGILERNCFIGLTNLHELGIPYKIHLAGEIADLEYTSNTGVEINFKPKAESLLPIHNLPPGKVAVAVTFKQANAIAFAAHNCKTSTIVERNRLGYEILARFWSGRWPKNHVVITEVVTAETTTILIADHKNAEVELLIDAGYNPYGINLASIGGQLSLWKSSGVGTKIVAAKRLSPLFRAAGIKQNLFAGTTFDTRAGADMPTYSAALTTFDTLDYAELE